MRVAVFTELYPPSVGGQEVRFAELASALVREGHSVDVFCVGHSRDLAADEIVEGVRVRRHPIGANYKDPTLRVTRRSIFPLLRYSYWCRRVALEGCYDWHVYNQWPLGHILLAPNDVRKRSAIDWCEIRHSSFFRVVQAKFPRLMRHNLAVSRDVMKDISSRSGRDVTYVPSGIYLDRYRALPREARSGIAYVGRIEEHKNVPFLVRSYALLKKTGYKGRLVIAGTGSGLAAVREEIKRLRLQDSAALLGFVSEEEKISLLAQSEVLALPSRREGFPRVIAEAIASGLPVVTADYAENGAQFVVKEYGSGVVSESDEESFARSILKVLDNWVHYSLCAIRRREELDWSQITRLVIGLAEGNS